MSERNYLPQFMVRGKNYSSNSRKAPGGDTNDIFGLEERQRERMPICKGKKMENEAAASDYKIIKKCFEAEVIISPCGDSGQNLRRSLSETTITSNSPTFSTPPLATGKENTGSYLCLPPKLKSSYKGKELDESDGEDVDKTSMIKEPERRNPITGDGVNNSASVRSKLEDSTNIAKDENAEPVRMKSPKRPCIRVRQPPGGKSSIIF